MNFISPGSRPTEPLRIEIPSTLYCVTSRGDTRADIAGDEDRRLFVEVAAAAIERLGWPCRLSWPRDGDHRPLAETPSARRPARAALDIPRAHRPARAE